MAVFTPLTDADIASFLKHYDVGTLVSAKGIAEGVENTNYLIETASAKGTTKYVITLFEARTSIRDLPFFLKLTDWLADHKIPAPRTMKTKEGDLISQIKGKPAALIEFLEGKGNPNLTLNHLKLVGVTVAKLQQAAKKFPHKRRNDLSLKEWKALFGKFRQRADEITPGLEKLMTAELDFLAAHWPKDLPSGVVHTDMFPDNIFFTEEAGKPKVTGIIDFYFACNDFYMYDLLLAVNAWCFVGGRFAPDAADALIFGYHGERTITDTEKQAMPVLARGAAMRILVTRAHDWLYHPEDAVVTRKDPLEYLAILQFHQQVKSHQDYGLI